MAAEAGVPSTFGGGPASVILYCSLIHVESQKCHLDWPINTNWL